MKVYVVEMWSDIHNCGYEHDVPMVFAKIDDANEYARSLFDTYYKEYKSGLQEIEDWQLTKPDENDASWSFNTDRKDWLECNIYESEVK